MAKTPSPASTSRESADGLMMKKYFIKEEERVVLSQLVDGSASINRDAKRRYQKKKQRHVLVRETQRQAVSKRLA